MTRGLPVMLRVEGRKCVIVGGGGVAVRRAASLVEAGAQVMVIAPHIDAALGDLPVRCEQRMYRKGDLEGAAMVVIATDNSGVNEQVAADAEKFGVLVNRADDPDAGDLTIPAHAHHGPVTIAVHTGGVSAAAAAAIRRQLSDALDPDWPRLLQVAGEFRERVQSRWADAAQRQEQLRRLTDEDAMAILKDRGEGALRQHLRGLVESS